MMTLTNLSRSLSQCAADMTNFSLINDPPHRYAISGRPPKPMAAICGNSVRSTLEPPIINGSIYESQFAKPKFSLVQANISIAYSEYFLHTAEKWSVKIISHQINNWICSSSTDFTYLGVWGSFNTFHFLTLYQETLFISSLFFHVLYRFKRPNQWNQ